MDQNDTNSAGRSRAIIIGGFAIVGVLLLVGLFLPPVSLGERLGLGASEPAETTTESEANEFAAESATQPEGVVLALSSGSAAITTVDQEEFAATNDAAVPENMEISGDIYEVSTVAGDPYGQVALPVPVGAADVTTLDLYGWEDSNWSFLPSQIDTASGQIISAEGPLPEAYAVMQTFAPEEVAIAGYVSSGGTLPKAVLPVLTDVVISGLKLNAMGALDGSVERQPDGAYDQWLQVTNVGPVIDQAALSTLLGDPALQEAQIEQLVALGSAGEYAGVVLDYQQVPENQGAAFTTFSSNLADALHEQDLRLAITLGALTYTGSAWNSGGQDLATLGALADAVSIALPLDPTQYDQDDEAAQLLYYVTRQIDRNKLSALFNAAAVSRFGDIFASLTNSEALSNFGELQFVQGGEEVTPNTVVEVALSGSANPLEWDGDSLTYKYSYEKNGQVHDIWLGNEAALNHRIQQANTNNLAGLGIRDLEHIEDSNGYAAVLGSLHDAGEAPQPTGAAIVWTVRNANDSVLASESGSELTFTWNVGDTEGDYTINADFALGENVAGLDSVPVAVAAATEETAEAEEPVETETAETEEAAEAEETASEEPPAEETEPTAAYSGSGDAVVTVGANIRTGPGLTYGTLSDGADPGTEVDVIGRNSDSSWLNIILPDGREGWIFSSLLTLNAATDVNTLEVVEVAAPAVAAASSTDGDAGDNDAAEAAPPAAAAAPPPVAAAPVSNPGFELGGQSHSFGNPQLMDYAGMNWIKFQHKWGSGDDPSAVAGRIQQAHANGFKVLLSIPGQNTYPDSIDFNAYVEFLRGVAALGPDAIEVWNEENIDFEWPAGSIDPASYVNNMLAPAYNAIKGANPNVMVISGAPAPTGYFGGGCGASGCDDSAYLAGMAAAGASNYMDCVGAHFNAGATSPGQSSGHPAGSEHYSWYFQPMLDLYYNSMGKPVCFTELGYLSGSDFGGVPSRFSWAGNTSVSQHAQWLAEAVSLAANSGKTRMAIIFNVDFTQFGDDPQAGYAMIRPDGSCPSCETLRQVMGR